MTTPLGHSDTSLRRLLVRAIAGAFVFGAVFTAFGAFGPLNEESGVETTLFLQWLVSLAALLVAGAVVWMAGKSGTNLGNLPGAANRALIFGLLTVVAFPVFWLGIYAEFAAGAFVLGGVGVRGGGSARGKSIAGLILAAIGTVCSAALNLFG